MTATIPLPREPKDNIEKKLPQWQNSHPMALACMIVMAMFGSGVLTPSMRIIRVRLGMVEFGMRMLLIIVIKNRQQILRFY